MEKLSGLNNIGNTCYMNSALQLLLNCKVLTQILLNYNLKSEILNNLKLFIKDYNKEGVSTPSTIKDIIQKYDKMFLGNKQQDAGEFLIKFLDIIEEEFKKEDNSNISGINLNDLISTIFDSNTTSIIFCDKYNEKSKNKDKVRILSLAIPNENNLNLSKCIDYYSKIEKLTDDAKWFYEKNNEYVDAYKRLYIRNLSKYLIIHLKRFTFFSNSMKDNREVCVDEQLTFRDKTYELRSIIYHMGGTNGGHYINLSKCKNIWYICDDSRVNKVDDIKKYLNKGYIYLFVKKK